MNRRSKESGARSQSKSVDEGRGRFGALGCFRTPTWIRILPNSATEVDPNSYPDLSGLRKRSAGTGKFEGADANSKDSEMRV